MARVNPVWKMSQKYLVGGVNSPVRSFRSVGGEPVFMERGRGAYLVDRSGHAYVDFCLSWGAILLGHADPGVFLAVQSAAEKGMSFGTVTEREARLAKKIQEFLPSLKKIRFMSSGTEAVMTALRLARGFTRRKRIVKFEGCYHGHSDSLLVKGGSGLATLGLADSLGVPPELAALTTVLPYNDAPAVRAVFKKHKDIACVIVEPIAGNMGVVPATREFLDALRIETRKSGALLVFDEVISGFRVGLRGAQGFYDITPDLTTLGKIIGGGLPIGAVGGRSEIMDHLAPLGGVYQAGTLSGNPLSMAAGLAVLGRVSGDFYKKLNRKTDDFLKEAAAVFKRRGIPVRFQSAGSMFAPFFTGRPVSDFRSIPTSHVRTYRKIFHKMLSSCVYWPPSAYEAFFISSAHGEREFDKFLRAV